MNRSNRYAASCGPAAASGWYCTENAGTSRQRSPSTTSSLRQTWLTPRPGRTACRTAPSRGRVDREAVVVRGDLDPPGRAVLHRLVDAAVAVAQLVGAQPERPAEHLVAEADAEHRQPAAEQSAGQRDRAVGGGRVARAVGQEHPVGPGREDLVDASRSRAARAPRCRAPPSAAASSRLMPRSMAATVNRALARSPARRTAAGVVTSPVRSAPAIGGGCQHPLQQRRLVGVHRR